MIKFYRAFNLRAPSSSLNKPTFLLSASYGSVRAGSVSLLLIFCLLLSVYTQAQSISGTVFFDGNNNGQRDNQEAGFPNVVVNAYRAGNLAGSATTDNDGNYSITAGIATGANYRIEFIVPAGYNDGATGSGSNTSVQFAAGGTSHVDLGIYVPNQCGSSGTSNPRILAGCVPSLGDITLASIPYESHSAGRQSCDVPPHRDDLTKYDIGVPYSLTIHKRQKLAILTTISSPNTSNFPPAPDGASALYAVDYSGDDFTYKSFKLLAKLSNLGIDVSNQFPIATGVNNIGEYGLGGITISEDEHYLYVLNMGKGNLIRVDIRSLDYQTIPPGGFTDTSQLPITEIDIPSAIANCSNGRFRPSSLHMYAGKLYIAGICDASLSTDNAGLYAKIIEMNPVNGNSRVVFSHDLTTFNTGDIAAVDLPQVRWKYPFRAVVADGNPGEKQPFFNDFGFDDTGSIIFSIVDRKVFSLESNREPGYLARTWKQDDGTFVLESDRQSGPFTSSAAITHSFTGEPANLSVDNGGPGTISGPKWFFEQGIDIYDSSPGAEQTYYNHANLANGGIYILPGTKEVVVGFTDAGCVSTAGMRYFDWTTGRTKYSANLTNQKYFAITGMSTVCDPTPIEIGNYIWKDTNRDGVQDPDEPALAGVTVALYANGSGDPIATAQTDANGNYSFSSADGTSTGSHQYGLSLHPDSSYSLKVISLGIDPLVDGLKLTGVSPAPGERADTLNTGHTLGNNDAFIVNGLPTISFVMNCAGQNNHTYDFGLIDVPCSLTTTITASSCDPATNTYSVTVVATVTESKETSEISIREGQTTRTFSTSVGSNSFTTVFTGIVSDGMSHTVTASLPNCSTVVNTYLAPAGCQPIFSLAKFTDHSKAKLGDTLTYRLVLTNSGTGAGTVTVRDSLSNGLSYITGSASAPAGTSFTVGQPVSLWNIPAIAIGQSLTLTYQVRVDTVGILYNVATIPTDTAKVCTTVPVPMCEGDQFLLTAATGRTNYRWYKDGVLISGQSSNTLIVTEGGTYSLIVDNPGGICTDFSCCPIIFEEDSLPHFQAIATSGTCLGNKPRDNGQIVLSTFKPTHTYQYSLGATFDEAASLSGPPQPIPADGVLVNNLTNPSTIQSYTVRVYNKLSCYTDMIVLLQPAQCDCPATICVPYVIKQTKNAQRTIAIH
ncbi:SdrD B-like domain-containing protein [Spirosoma sp. SC4-14]|uniref:SdrD B-like domain-containing protein n=1 Tax=Spirosoma sp. SC4-14 TaxID=3128900 RepID=UPI0030CBE36A